MSAPEPQFGLAAVHGGPDAAGVPLHDFSTNSNAAGPCDEALRAVQCADATHYPDPQYHALREALGRFHQVAPERVVLAASASEFVHRMTAAAALRGARIVCAPRHGYGEYARAAAARGLEVRAPGGVRDAPVLEWACEPSSPLGLRDAALRAWGAASAADGAEPLRVLDCAYQPLLLGPDAAWAGRPPHHLPEHCWQLWSPNKALGMTGVRAAYAIAPPGAHGLVQTLLALAPSWPVGAHGAAMLHAWVQPGVQRWVVHSLGTLRSWKSRQLALCTDMGWAVHAGSLANYFCAQPDTGSDVAALQDRLAHLRRAGIKLRDCASFGLAGSVRMGVLPPPAQDALHAAWLALRDGRTMPGAPATS